MVTMVRYVVDLPIDAVEAQIGNAFDFIVQMTRARTDLGSCRSSRRFLFDREKRACVVEPIYARGLLDACGRWLRRLLAWAISSSAAWPMKEVDR